MRRLLCTAGLFKFQLSWLTDNKNKVSTFIRNLTYRMKMVFCQNEIKAAVYGKRRKLAQAFDILKVPHGGRQVVTYTVWCELMKRVIPNRSRSHIDLLIRVLDIDGSNMISEYGSRIFLILHE